MKIAENSVVGIAYTLKSDDGELLDQVTSESPFYYLQGLHHILPAIEKQLMGKEAGFKTHLELKAEHAYGKYMEQLVVKVPREHFPADVDLQVGMRFNTDGPDGEPVIVEIVEVEEKMITLDGNHPLAGMDLFFDIEVLTVRHATAEELEHGHVHGPGGHHGHGGGHLH